MNEEKKVLISFFIAKETKMEFIRYVARLQMNCPELKMTSGHALKKLLENAKKYDEDQKR